MSYIRQVSAVVTALLLAAAARAESWAFAPAEDTFAADAVIDLRPLNEKVAAAMKKEGIYCTISPYWAACGLRPSWGIKGHNDAWGVLFIDQTLQGGYKAWLKALYTEKNPETGIPLAQDPAVAVIQLQNE